MNLAWCAMVALLLGSMPVAAQPTPEPVATASSVEDLSAAGVEGWIRTWITEQRAILPQLDEEVQREEVRAREVRDTLLRIRSDATGQKTVLALGELRPTDFARARRNWREWRAVAQSYLDQSVARADALAARKAEQEERWALLNNESTADLLPSSPDVVRQAQAVERRVKATLDRLANLANSAVEDAKAAIALCDETVELLDKTLLRLQSRFFAQRVNSTDWSAAVAGLRKDLAAFMDPLADTRALDSGDRLLGALRQNALALLTGLVLVGLVTWRVRRYAATLESAAGQLGAQRRSVLSRFAAAILLALSRTAGLAVVSAAGLLLQLNLGASSPAWLEALIALLRAFFLWRLIVAFLGITLDPTSDRFRLLMADADAAELSRQWLERVADWLFAGLFISTLIRFVGLASPPLMLGFLVFQLAALHFFARSLADERIAKLGLTGGWATAARQWRALLHSAMVLSLGLAGLGFLNLGWYVAWGTFNTSVLALVALLIWRLAADAIDESIPEAEAWTSRSLRRLWGVGLFVVSAVAVPFVWGVASNTLAMLREFLAVAVEIGTAKLTLGSILAALLCILAAWVLGRIVKAVFTRRVFPHSMVEPGVREAITTTTEYVLLAVGVLLAIRTLGFDLTSLAIIAGALSVGLGFGMQTLVSNLVSGLIILFERPFRPGDILEHEGVMGSVRRIRTRSTIVQTFDEAELVLPNSELLSKRITNWTLSNNRTRATININVAYDSDLALVRDTLIEVASQHPRLIEEPKLYFTAFGDSALEFRLMIWVDVREKMQVVSDVLYAIEKAFREKQIEIPYPQRVIRHIHVDGTEPPPGSE